MKAAVVTDFAKPLEIVDRAVPEPGPDEVLIRLETSGLCHTDIHAAHGDWPVKPALPFIPGHEGVGIVEKLGDAVTGRRLGERVAIPWLGYACGECRYCIDGRETCARSSTTAATRSMELSPNTRSPARSTSCQCPTASPRWIPLRSPVPV